jgi:opacity protein-like surface antigen
MKKFLLGFAAAAALLSAAAPVSAAVIFTKESASVTALGDDNYSFTLNGWSGGGTMTGTFSGTALPDAEGNPGTQIIWFGGGALTAFLANFSGNGLIGPLVFTRDDLFGFVYTLGNANFGTDTSGAIEGIGATLGPVSFVFGPGPFALCDGQQDCGRIETQDLEVSEPATLALLGAGLLGLAAVRRRKA